MIRAVRLARRSRPRPRRPTSSTAWSSPPEELRARLRSLKLAELVAVAARFRPVPITSPVAATKLAMAEFAHRHQALAGEIARLDAVSAYTSTSRSGYGFTCGSAEDESCRSPVVRAILRPVGTNLPSLGWQLMILSQEQWMNLCAFKAQADAGATWAEIARETSYDWRTALKRYLSADAVHA
jgi:hypothetical protein